MFNGVKSIAFYTLGCKLNFSETSHISRMFAEKGFQVVDEEETADYYVIQSCVVTDVAEKKCRNLIRSIKKRAPQSKIAVVGCYSELKKSQLEAMPEVDYVLGNFEKYQLTDRIMASEDAYAYIQETDGISTNIFVPTFSSGDRTRTFLKEIGRAHV